MSRAAAKKSNTSAAPEGESAEANLRQSPMMAHLLDALNDGKDIGHYGRLTFVMVARHFMDEEDLVTLLARQPEQSYESVRAMLTQVKERGYNPPKRERILEWQAQQDFPICPDSDNPGACSVYRDLKFPEAVYEEIQEFYEERAAA